MKVTKHSAALLATTVAAITALTMAFGGVAAAAPAEIPPTAQGLADAITAGLKPLPGGQRATAIVDTGSSSGSAGVSHASAAVGEGPEQDAFLAAFGYSLLHPDAAPPGANRWDCKPSAAHPEPVVLVHGTWLNAYDTFAYLSPQLAKAGYCVFTFNFGRSNLLQGGGIGSIMPGVYGVGPMEDSAVQLADFVDQVRTATGVTKVDVIAHSQGGPVARQYLKFNGGAEKVDQLVTFGATNHGTSLLGFATIGRIMTNIGLDILGFYQPIIGPANIQQVVGSSFYAKLNADGDTLPGIRYTAIATTHDEVSNPYEWTFLTAGPDATVDNITVQAGCEQDISDHLTLMYSPRATALALQALDPATPRTIPCTFNPWFFGGGGHL
ncbi:esterase/lipase family protein [Nocardia huaxiensis]|uniref:esterase/lipase family protein n=1 Tax=Nocardia huaxiensis TaxID=2755382 RepID=UPI001E5E4469|nr:alpha/beta fold hydrolase [Nocardia huaxiensis]UFS98119.1 alpha/beta fold hydrolase [Nocardia huaxiensis]